MITKGRVRLSNRKKIFMKVDKFDGGVNTLFSETRLKNNEAKEATNMILIEDGIWTKRWGTAHYGGVSFTNTIDGFSEYKKTDGTRELIVVADGKVYKVDPDAETSTEISGATFTQGTRCDFAQIGSVLYIVNGTDPMARYDGSSLSTYSSINTPAWAGTPLARGGGLSAGNFTYYYRVSAVNEVGETLAAAEESITVNIDRDLWDAADEIITVDWSASAGALKYIVYFSDTSGYEVKLAEVIDTTYVDDGSATPNPYIEPPTADTSAGPLFTCIEISGNRIWGTGDTTAKQRVYFSGSGANLGNFATGYGGGWVDLETGGRNQCVAVKDYQGLPHVFCKTDEGRGSVWQVELTSATLGSSTITIPVPEKIIPSVGSNSFRSIVDVENDIYFMNPNGVFTLGNETGVLNVLRTNEMSSKIRPYISDLYQPSSHLSSAYYYDSKVFFSVSTSSGEPNKTIVYDRERSAWIKDWTLGVSQFGEFTDSGGTSHFLGINGTKLVEFSANYQGDQGTAFTWRYISPRFSISDDWSQFAKIKRAFVRMRDVRGEVAFSVSGTDRSGNTIAQASDTIAPGTSSTGIGWDKVGNSPMGSTLGIPSSYAVESFIRYVEIRKLLRDLQWQVSGDALADTAALTGIMAEGNVVEVAKPEVWRLD